MKGLKLFVEWVKIVAGEVARLLLLFPAVNFLFSIFAILFLIDRAAHRLMGKSFEFSWKGIRQEWKDMMTEDGIPIFDWVAILYPREYTRPFDRAEKFQIKRGILSPYRVWLDHRRPIILSRWKRKQ